MSKRKILAVAVILVWVAALAWQAKRLYLVPEAEQLAAAARTLPPGVAYYSVWHGERRAGWGQTQIDTLPSASGFVIRDRLELDLGFLGMPGGASVRSRAELGPILGLRWFTLEARGLMGGLSARGRVVGDTVLELSVRRGGTGDGGGAGEPIRERIPVEGPVTLGTALPLRLAAEGGVQPGEELSFRTFDPLEMQLTTRTVEILDRQVRTFPDSAVMDDETGDWRVARHDTVLAWRVERELGGVTLRAWIDEDGRYLELETPAGLRLERTAFELAYNRWLESRQ